MQFSKVLGYLLFASGVILVLYFAGVANSLSGPFAGETGPPNLPRTYAVLLIGIALATAGYYLIELENGGG